MNIEHIDIELMDTKHMDKNHIEDTEHMDKKSVMDI